jgi:hypothetical protein
MKDIVLVVSYYDKDVKLLGESTEKIEKIEANGTWEFTTNMPKECLKDFKAYRISKISGHK